MINYPRAGAFAAPQHIDVIFLTNVEQSQRGFGKMSQYLEPVSYTHLTLPTILLV